MLLTVKQMYEFCGKTRILKMKPDSDVVRMFVPRTLWSELGERATD